MSALLDPLDRVSPLEGPLSLPLLGAQASNSHVVAVGSARVSQGPSLSRTGQPAISFAQGAVFTVAR